MIPLRSYPAPHLLIKTQVSQQFLQPRKLISGSRFTKWFHLLSRTTFSSKWQRWSGEPIIKFLWIFGSALMISFRVLRQIICHQIVQYLHWEHSYAFTLARWRWFQLTFPHIFGLEHRTIRFPFMAARHLDPATPRSTIKIIILKWWSFNIISMNMIKYNRP